MNYYKRGLFTWSDVQSILNRIGLMSIDMTLVAGGYLLAFAIRFYFPPFVETFPIVKGLPALGTYVQALPAILILWAVSLTWQESYQRINIPALDDMIRITRATFLGTILSMSAMFLYRESSYSRLVFGLGGVLSGVLLFGSREIIKVLYLSWIRRSNRHHRVLILGNGRLSNSLQKILERQGDRVVIKSTALNLDSIQEAIQTNKPKQVLVAHPDIKHKDIVTLAEYCENTEISFRIIPDILEIRMGEVLIDESLGIPTFQIKSVSLHGISFFTKRIFDVVLSSLILGILSFPLLTIAILIKLTSKGPILYKHTRMGFKGREFNFLKFRTMVVNADDLLQSLKEKSDRSGPVFKMKSDPRVTWIGRFLRRYSLDELPQLFNVLRGEMSLVGPRPQVIWEAEAYDSWARKRLNVLPGITGLWQVSGRAELTYEEMIELDIFYIENWSAGMDVKILLKTVPAVLSGKGAY